MQMSGCSFVGSSPCAKSCLCLVFVTAPLLQMYCAGAVTAIIHVAPSAKLLVAGTLWLHLRHKRTLLCLCHCCCVLRVQAVAASTRAPNAAEVLKSVGVYHLDPELADTVMSLRMYRS